VLKVVFRKSYMLEIFQGSRLPREINGRYSKKYNPSAAHRINMADVYIVLRCKIADELDIVAI